MIPSHFLSTTGMHPARSRVPHLLGRTHRCCIAAHPPTAPAFSKGCQSMRFSTRSLQGPGLFRAGAKVVCLASWWAGG